MKKPLLTIATIAAAITLLNADTITWTGNGDGKTWSDVNNWVASSTGQAPDHVPLAVANSGDQVVISGSGVEVEYNGGDPWIGSGESITISGGAKLMQTVASWWHGENGSVVIDGGAFDTGSCSGTHAWSFFNVSNGGALIARTSIPDANVTLDPTATYEVFSANNYSYTGTEKFTRLTATVQGAELHTQTNVFSKDVVWTCNLISASGVSIVWEAGSLVLWDTAWGGYYNAGGTIDIAEGWTGSFTFAYPPASVFNSCFKNKIKYNGTDLTEESFEEFFEVTQTTVTDPSGVDHIASRVALAAETDWKLGAISVSEVSSSNAVLTAAVASVGTGAYSLYMACSTDAITEENITSIGRAVTVTDGVSLNVVEDLADLTVYNYAFAIVTNDAVAAFKSGSFVASDYEYVYNNGWVGGVGPGNLYTSSSVLFLSDYSYDGDFILENKRVICSVLRTSTLHNGTMIVENSAVVNRRVNLLSQTPYGFIGNPYPLDFFSASGNGTMRRACSYTFRSTDEQLAAFYQNIVAGGRIKVGGETISPESYAANFSLETEAEKVPGSYDYGEGEVEEQMNVSTFTMWDIPPFRAAGNWVFQDGARVRLNKNTSMAALNVETEDVKIDLNGYALKVSSLTIAGEKKKGEFTAATLPAILTGEGSLTVSGPGFAVFVR